MSVTRSRRTISRRVLRKHRNFEHGLASMSFLCASIDPDGRVDVADRVISQLFGRRPDEDLAVAVSQLGVRGALCARPGEVGKLPLRRARGRCKSGRWLPRSGDAGLLQITGRSAYTHFGQQLNFDLAGDPDQAFGPTPLPRSGGGGMGRQRLGRQVVQRARRR